MKIYKIILINLIFIFISAFGKSQTSISQAQAVFIYNFTRLIEWPADSKTGNFEILIYGSNELDSDVKKYTNSKFVGTQPISVNKCSSIEEIKKPHILFIAYGKTKEMEAIKNKIGSNSTLIITEKKGSLDLGAIINFVIVEDKLKFELKIGNATRVGLKIHSNLENMAIAKY
jgi:hypothetical protein